MSYDIKQITTPNGTKFNVEIDYDDCCAPWEECDGYGAVSGWTTRDKKPGEWVLCTDYPHRRYYDFKGAVRKAKAEGWGCDGLTGNETSGEQAVKAATADFNHLKSWYDNKWFYACLHVTLLDSDGNEMVGYDDYMGGIEYGANDRWQTVAQDMAAEIETRYREDQSAALTAEMHSVKDNALFAEGIL